MRLSNSGPSRQRRPLRLAAGLATVVTLLGVAMTSASADAPLSLGRPNPEGTSI